MKMLVKEFSITDIYVNDKVLVDYLEQESQIDIHLYLLVLSKIASRRYIWHRVWKMYVRRC